MAAPLSGEVFSKFVFSKPFLSQLTLSRLSTKITGTYMQNAVLHNTRAIIFKSRFIYTCTVSTSSSRATKETEPQKKFPGQTSVLQAFSHALINCLVPSRQYGRKKVLRPPKIDNFEYSGDLRALPELDKTVILSKYKGLEHEMEGNEVLKKLCSLEFATPQEYAEHRQQMIRERIVALFGPDSEIEQEIAILTLGIRQLIPFCIKYRSDKASKYRLLSQIDYRKQLLTDLRQMDHERFEWLLKELKIQYVIPRDPEPHLGWKHNLRVATKEEVASKQRKQLEQLKAKFDEEKKVFFEHKAKLLTQFEEELQAFGLDRSYIDHILLQKKEFEQKELQKKELEKKQLEEAAIKNERRQKQKGGNGRGKKS